MAIEPRNLRDVREINTKVNFESFIQLQALYGPASATITAPDTFVDVAAADGKVGDKLRILTPLTLVEPSAGIRHYVPWTNGESIDAFSFAQVGFGIHEDGAVQLHQTNEVFGVVVFGGKIPYQSIALYPGQTEANLKAALRNGMRAKGFTILELEGVN